MESLTKAHIWNTRSSIDVAPLCTETEHLSDTGLKYLPWMQAHELMMGVFPEYTWEFSEDQSGREVHYFDDGSAEVRCRMTIGTHTVITYLPVHRSGIAIKHPNAMDINTAKQRARVKALGEFGLGYTMWLTKTDPVFAVPEVATEVSQAQMVEELWLTTKILDASNKSAGQKIFNRFTKGLDNRGWEDQNTTRWEEVCQAKGWRAEK